MSRDTRLVATGFALIAVCYGFARFAYGLFLPAIDAELDLPATLSGWIAGSAFLGYGIAILAAASLTERWGARPVALAAALVAAAGMIGIATADGSLWLAISVLVAGSSTGLASPPLASAVAASLRPRRQARANTIINAGTGAGVVLSGPVALVLADQWRVAFLAFAATALAMALVTALVVPGRTPAQPPIRQGLPRLTGPLRSLIRAAFLTGLASTAVWSFGSELTAQRLGWTTAEAGHLWIAIGAAGIVGAGAGWLIHRCGLALVHRAGLFALAAGLLCIGTAGTTAALTLAGGALFGAAYIVLTGAYLVWGVEALPARPATGLTIGFLALAIGQTAGAPLFAALLHAVGAGVATAAFAAVGLATAWCIRPPERQADDVSDRAFI